MTKIKIAYWSSTGVLCLMYVAGALMYLTQRATASEAFVALGYPTYLISVLIVVKILGVVAILSRKWIALSDLAYAGMFYHLLLAFSAHLNAGDGGFVPALIGLVALLMSFFTQNAVRTGVSPYAGRGSGPWRDGRFPRRRYRGLVEVGWRGPKDGRDQWPALHG